MKSISYYLSALKDEIKKFPDNIQSSSLPHLQAREIRKIKHLAYIHELTSEYSNKGILTDEITSIDRQETIKASQQILELAQLFYDEIEYQIDWIKMARDEYDESYLIIDKEGKIIEKPLTIAMTELIESQELIRKSLMAELFSLSGSTEEFGSASPTTSNPNPTASIKKLVQLEKKKIESEKDKFLSDLKKLEEESKERITEFNSEIESLANIISTTSENKLAEIFDKQAREDKKTADKYRILSIALLIACGTGNIALYLVSNFSEISSMEYLQRSSSILVFLLPAFYLIKESSKHRNQETKNMRISLILRSLNSYLADTSSSTKDLIKATLAKEMFSDKESTSTSNMETISMIKEVKDILK